MDNPVGVPCVVGGLCLAFRMRVMERLEDLSGSELLDEVELLHDSQRRTEILILKAAVRHADLNHPSGLDPGQARRPGRERAVRLGGVGTPEVREFAAAELGGRLQLSSYAAGRLMADGLDLRHRLPRLWQRVEEMEVRVGHARYVARRTRDLSVQQAGFVDERVAESADGRLSWTRFTDLVEAMIVASDPEAAAEREEAAAQAQFAQATRSTDHGMRGFYIRAPFPVIARIDATVAYLADALLALGDTSTLDQRRVKALLVMANPTEAVELLKAFAAHRATTGPQTEPDRGRHEPSCCPRCGCTCIWPGSKAPEQEVSPGSRDSARSRRRGSGTTWGRLPVQDHPGHRPGRPSTRGRLRDPGPTSTGRASDDAGRHLPVLHEHLPRHADRPHRALHPRRRGDRRRASHGSGNYGPMSTHPPPDQDPRHAGTVRQPFDGIYLWRDPHGESTSSTTPAPARAGEDAECRGLFLRVKGVQPATAVRRPIWTGMACTLSDAKSRLLSEELWKTRLGTRPLSVASVWLFVCG